METERVDNVVDLGSTILNTLLGFLSRCVGSSVCVVSVWGSALGLRGIRTDFDGAEGDHGTVNLVDNTIDFLEIIGVGDDLIIGENVL